MRTSRVNPAVPPLRPPSGRVIAQESCIHPRADVIRVRLRPDSWFVTMTMAREFLAALASVTEATNGAAGACAQIGLGITSSNARSTRDGAFHCSCAIRTRKNPVTNRAQPDGLVYKTRNLRAGELRVHFEEFQENA